MESGATPIRGKDWLFNALWSSCGETNNSPFIINVPVTVIFKDGQPYRSLRSEKGELKRVYLESHEPERFRGVNGFRGDAFKLLRNLREILLNFAESRKYITTNVSEDTTYICTVFYNDGEKEEISISKFDVLMRNDSWRFQIQFVQAFVPISSTSIGYYSSEKKVRSLLEKHSNEAADHLTRALAKFAENAYKLNSSTIIPMAAVKEINLTMKELRAVFATDEINNELFFLYTDHVSVEIKGGSARKEVEDYMKDEKSSRESSAAQSVLSELLSLLQHAQRRGLQSDESFKHFDVNNAGFIDVDRLIDGLARLGIGVTYPVGEALFQMIGGVGAVFLTSQDFDNFVKDPPDIEAFQGSVHVGKIGSSLSPRTSTRASNTQPSLRTRSSGGGTGSKVRGSMQMHIHIPDELKPAPKTHLPINRNNLKLPSMQQQNSVNDYDDNFAAIEESQNRSWVSEDELSVTSAAVGKQNNPIAFPLAESEYKVHTVPKQNALDLPPWASKRQQRALSELKKTQVQWLKNKGPPPNPSSSSSLDSISTADLSTSSISKQQQQQQPSCQDSKSRQTKSSASTSSNHGMKKTQSSLKKLNLTGIVNEMTRELHSSPDELLHIDHGLVMTYRVVLGAGSKDEMKTKEQSDVLRNRSILEVREKNIMKNETNGVSENKSVDKDEHTQSGQKVDRWVSFTLIIIPDLFSTLDSLQNHLEGILVKYPLARLIFVGLPGLPHTTWPEGWVLNSDLHSRSIAKLLVYLKKEGRIGGSNSSEPVFMMGFGLGAYSLSRFIVNFLPGMSWLESRLKVVSFVNGILKFNKAFKKICKDLRQSLTTAGTFEVNELMTSLHFWDQYLSINGREECLRKFWSMRKDLRNDGREEDEKEKAGLSYFGVLEMLKGILINPDDFDGAMILETEIPVIVIQSTEDVFVDPRNAALFQPSSLPPERRLVDDVTDCLDPSAVFVNWLKAGHEVVQERNSFILGLISNLAQMCGIHPSDVVVVEEKSSDVDDEVFDVLALSEVRKKQREAEIKEKKRAEYERILAEKASIEKETEEEATRIEKELKELAKKEAADLAIEREYAAHEMVRLEIIRREEEAALLDQERELERIENDNRRERLNTEKEKRLKLADERRRREAWAAKKAEMDVLYDKEREVAEMKNEARELKAMAKEEFRCHHAEDYFKECEIAERSADLSKHKSKLLIQSRKEEAIKRVEEQMALERSRRIEERRRKAEEIVKQIDAEELILTGEQDGGYNYESSDGDKVDVIAVILATQRLLKDLMECRQQSVEALKRQMLIEQKYYMFKKQCSSLEVDLQRLRRAIRLIQINPSIVGAHGKAVNEIAELNKSLSQKEESFAELSAVTQQREAQLSASNRRVQLLKIASRERDALMSHRIKEMHELEITLTKKVRALKMDREHIVVERDKFRIKDIVSQNRIDAINKELKRIKDHTSEFVDTDVWVEGVMQRVRNVDLKKYLNKELEIASQKKHENHQSILDLNEKLNLCSDQVALTRRDSDKIGMAAKSFMKTFQKYAAVTIADITKALSEQHDAAERMEDLRKNEHDVNKLANAMKSCDLVDKIKLKDPELRTRDERRYLGMDMVMHPEDYIHISILEAEQMQFDEDYQSDLTKSDLERIEKLPELVNLALPFLHTEKEISAHRLFNQFKRGHDESYYRLQDFMSEGAIDESSSQLLTEDSGLGLSFELVKPKDIEEAEVVHDILVRESRRDRLRALGEGETMSIEQREWLQIDKILAPHVYDVSELRATNIYDRNVLLDLSTSVINEPEMDGITKSKFDPSKSPIKYQSKQEGDIYDDLRNRYDNGEVIFDDSWRCPFNKDKLFKIRNSKTEPRSSEELKVKDLMAKYFVDENESVLGHKRLKALQNVFQEIAASNKRVDDLAKEELTTAIAVATVGLTSTGANTTTTALTTSLPDEFLEAKPTLHRIWGSWEQVHPASAGALSQESYFMVSAFNASRDHPASYAVNEKSAFTKASVMKEVYGLNSTSDEQTDDARRETSMKILTSMPSKKLTEGQFDQFHNDPNSKWFICESIRELAMQEPKRIRGKVVLIVKQDRMSVFEIKDATLQSRQSRSHKFELSDRDDARVLDISVSIVYQGSFTTKGYRLGRLAASLFRLPDDKDKNSSPLPSPVGFAPYSAQVSNLPDAMGKILILHRPRARPMKPNAFQIVVGAASNTKYSIEVTCKYAQTALPIVDTLVEKARELQGRLPICLKELEDLGVSLRIAERKLLICNKMIEEADTEAKRCLKGMRFVSNKLELDDEEMTLLDEERKDLQRELAIFEVEYAQWARVFTTRVQEKEDIKEGINSMHIFQRERLKEKKKLQLELEDFRRDLPACVSVLRSYYEATNVASALNTVVQGPSSAYSVASTGKNSDLSISTPAEDIRRRIKREGFKKLTLEEQQWCLLDQSLNPQKYEWLREQEDEEDNERISQGKKPKIRKLNAALEPYKMHKVEIDSIMATPFSMLNRKDMTVRKLLTKIHDDPEVIKKQFTAAGYGFDPHRAERTRAKNSNAYSREQAEWASIDKLLHPEVWRYYVNSTDGNLDEHAKASALTVASSTISLLTSNKGNHDELSSTQYDQQSAVNTVGRLLGIDDSVATSLTSLKSNTVVNVEGFASNAHKKFVTDAGIVQVWTCPFNKDQILRIWRTPRRQLKTDDDRRVFKLLIKYNGTFKYYIDGISESRRRQANGTQAGKHIRWEENGNVVSNDVDLQARKLLYEIDRSTHSKNEWMYTSVLHGNNQQFPTRVLRMHLEETLDTLLMEQIKERERSEKYHVDSDTSDANSDESESDISVNGDEGGGSQALLDKIRKRAKNREKRRMRLKKGTEETQVLQAKKKLIGIKNKSGAALADAILMNDLGLGGCLACRANPCRWEPSVNVAICTERKRVLDREHERVKLDKASAVIESDVCLSAQLGGNRVFRRLDLLEELSYELTELDRRLQLNNIDRELHDCYATRKEYFEVKHLHGYAMMLWTNNARQALQARQSRLVAYAVAKDAIDDILDWMLEGWFFGERESSYNILGNVPTIKKDGPIKSGQDQFQGVGAAISKIKKRNDAIKKGVVLDESRRGLMIEKSKEVEEDAQLRLVTLKVARDGNAHEHNLNETESTLKFGLFMLTLMYFRAMVFLRRDKKSFSGEDDDVSNTKGKGKLLTNERMKMLSEESRAVARKKKVDAVLQRSKVGEQRKRDREAAERREAIFRLQAIVKRQKLEVDSICSIQRVFRGHIGRKAARRWALKRAELGAMNELLNASSTCLQRVFRGYSARSYAVKKRMEMAQFIALMRAQEAASDESVYWETHPWQRFKRNQKEWVDTKFRQEHQVKVLGAARLTREEQARLLGKTIDEVEDEKEDLDDDIEEESDEDTGSVDQDTSDMEDGTNTGTGMGTRRSREDTQTRKSALSSKSSNKSSRH